MKKSTIPPTAQKHWQELMALCDDAPDPAYMRRLAVSIVAVVHDRRERGLPSLFDADPVGLADAVMERYERRYGRFDGWDEERADLIECCKIGRAQRTAAATAKMYRGEEAHA